MADNRTISQLEAEGYPWIGCKRLLSAMTLDQLGAKMRSQMR